MPGGSESAAVRDSAKLCGAKTQTGAACRHYSGFKTDHPGFGRCYRHGGSNPNGKRAAAKELVAEVVRAVDARRTPFYGQPGKTTARAALREELARSTSIVAHLEAMLGGAVGGLDPEARNAALSPAQLETLKALHIERAHLVRVSETVTRLELDRLDVETLEDISNRIGRGLMGFIEAVGLEPRDPQVRRAAREFLQKLVAEREDELKDGGRG